MFFLKTDGHKSQLGQKKMFSHQNVEINASILF